MSDQLQKKIAIRRLGKAHPGVPGRRGQLFIEFAVPVTMSPEEVERWLHLVFQHGAHGGPVVDVASVEVRLAVKTEEEKAKEARPPK